ncbi:hypothetical protein SLEP1_g57044 [Rubroshorea leprosula]|uniref:Uncharacterized protein n=1 Tax=Rubroshorea leprosula TaxID=152421 RepID=A0AAV5MNL1_9ROSI|nr:hypothetical protein SLEP1_g57044 [Rubroshorea leprosula]
MGAERKQFGMLNTCKLDREFDNARLHLPLLEIPNQANAFPTRKKFTDKLRVIKLVILEI